MPIIIKHNRLSRAEEILWNLNRINYTKEQKIRELERVRDLVDDELRLLK